MHIFAAFAGQYSQSQQSRRGFIRQDFGLHVHGFGFIGSVECQVGELLISGFFHAGNALFKFLDHLLGTGDGLAHRLRVYRAALQSRVQLRLHGLVFLKHLQHPIQHISHLMAAQLKGDFAVKGTGTFQREAALLKGGISEQLFVDKRHRDIGVGTQTAKQVLRVLHLGGERGDQVRGQAELYPRQQIGQGEAFFSAHRGKNVEQLAGFAAYAEIGGLPIGHNAGRQFPQSAQHSIDDRRLRVLAFLGRHAGEHG